MVTRKAERQAISMSTSSPASSPTSSVLGLDGHDVTMTMSEPAATPLTVAIPHNIAFSQNRKPKLADILANTAPPPYSLSSFMAFLSQNHCLENLEFTMDASRYRKHYSKMVNRHPGTPISPLSDECAYILMLWRRLIDAYIRESGPREVNLPAQVRDDLLCLSDSYVPPHPSSLDEAVTKIYELMEESVLVSFLHSVSPPSAHPSLGHDCHDSHTVRFSARSYDENFSCNTQQHSPAHQRASAPSSLSSTFMQARPFSHSRFHSQPTSSGPANARHSSSYTSGSDAMTDDSSSGSPAGLNDPLTPPGTPPTTDYPLPDFPNVYCDSGPGSGTPSPRNSRGDHNALATATRDSWKRVSSKLWPKKKSSGQLREDDATGDEAGVF